MPPRARRIDDNQNQIVSQLRRIGCTVAITSSLGKGFPDLVVGHRGINYLFELKDGSKTESRKKLTPDEKAFFERWRGQVQKVESIDQILEIIT